jgi:hypothetical protein
MVEPVKFPYSDTVHLGEPGGYFPVCGWAQSSAQPKNTLQPANAPVSCVKCLARAKDANEL